MRYLRAMFVVLTRFFRSGLRFLSEEVGLGLLGSRRARRKLLRRIENDHKQYSEQIEALRTVADGLALDDLQRYADLEADRRKAIDDKAKTYLSAVTIAITVLFAGLNLLNTELSGSWKAATVAPLTANVVYPSWAG